MSIVLNSFHELLLKKGIAFVRYSLPGQTNAITLVSYLPKSETALSNYADNQQEGFIFAPFVSDLNHPVWFLSADEKINEETNIEAIEDFILQLPDIIIRKNFEQESTTKGDYAKSFNNLMRALNSSVIDKVILSKIVIRQKTKESLYNLFTRLSETYPNAFTYLIQLAGGEIWMGASPELLLKQDNKGIETMALAGTQVYENQKLSDVVWKYKEIEEQAYVKNYVQKVLEANSESVSISKTYSTLAGNLVHLRTDFNVENLTNRAKAFEIAAHLHPTPAICGIPLTKSRELILEEEKHERAYYTGFLGPVNNSSFSLFVNLRCMQILPEKYALYVGGGITHDSEMEKEWLETEAKAQTLLSVIEK